MSFDMNPEDEDPHGECRHEIHTLQGVIAAIRAKLETIVATDPVDRGVVLLSYDSTTHKETRLINGNESVVNVYDNEHFSPLGDALIEVWEMTKP